MAGHIKHFRLRYLQSKKKRSDNWSIRFDKRDIKVKDSNHFTLYPKSNDKLLFETHHEIGDIDGDCTLNYDGDNFWLIIPKKMKPIQQQNQFKDPVLSIDPGEKTFITTYSNNLSPTPFPSLITFPARPCRRISC